MPMSAAIGCRPTGASTMASLAESLHIQHAHRTPRSSLTTEFSLLEGDYLASEFFVNANGASVGPRLYYSRLLAVMNEVMPVHFAFVVLTILAKSLMPS